MRPPHLIRTALGRGWRKCCPHCGRGRIYGGWVRAVDRCADCGLVYERDQGATWFFINIGDRIFIGLLIALIYFGVERTHPRLAILLFVIVGAALVWTTPNRWGVCTALHYLSRVYSADPDDPIPDVTNRS
jgi:uncharacterized protein (DUF983 family)